MWAKGNKKDDPILNRTPKQITHVRICLETAAYSSTTTEDQHPQRTSM